MDLCMQKVSEKLNTCLLILSHLKSDTSNNLTYEHINVLVLCVEALALQDKIMSDELKKQLGKDNVENDLKQFGVQLIGAKDFEFCQKFRLELFHGKKYYTLEDFESLIQLPDCNLAAFISRLVDYFTAAKTQLEKIQQGDVFDDNLNDGCLSTLFDLNVMESINCGIEFVEKPGDLKPMVEQMLNTAKKCGVANFNDLLETEEAIYHFSVSMYSILDKLFKSKKAKRNEFIQSIREERGQYVHEFCTSQELLQNNRRLLMIRFARSWTGYWYRYFLAADIHERINSSEPLNPKELNDIFLKSTSELKINYRIFKSLSKNSPDSEIKECMENYLRLMAPIDSEESKAERELKHAFVELSAYDKREIYEEFIILRETYNIDSGKYNIERKILLNQLLKKGFTKDTFLEMEKSFIETKDSEHKSCKLLLDTVSHLTDIIKTFCNETAATGPIIDNVPSHRKISEYKTQKYTLKNLDEKIISTFCGTDMKNLLFADIKDAFKDSKFLDILELMQTNSFPQESKNIYASLKNEDYTYIATYASRILQTDDTSSNDYVELVASTLLNDTAITENTESLRCLLNYFKAQGKKRVDTYELIIGKILDCATNTDDKKTNLSRIFTIHKESKKGMFDLDFSCMENILSRCKSYLPKEGKNIMQSQLCFCLFVQVIKEVYYHNDNIVNAMQFLKQFITDKNSILYKISERIRMEVIGLCTTLAAKIKNEQDKIAKHKIEKEQNKIAKPKIKLDEKTFIRMARTFRDFVNPFGGLVNEFEHLYDTAFHASEFENNHFLAFELYKILLNSILSTFGHNLDVTQPREAFLPHNCYPVEIISTTVLNISDIKFDSIQYSEGPTDDDASFPFVGGNVFSSILDTAEYKAKVKLGKHEDLVYVLKDMAYECWQIAKQQNVQGIHKWQYTEAAIGFYKNAHELDILQGNTMGTKILYPLVMLSSTHSKKNLEVESDKKRFMAMAHQYAQKIKDICDRKYLPSHPAAEKISKFLKKLH